jgi:hypothetical protein
VEEQVQGRKKLIEARELREIGVPVATLEILERVLEDAAGAHQWDDLRLVQEEAEATAVVFPAYASRARAIALKAREAVDAPRLPAPPERIEPMVDSEPPTGQPLSRVSSRATFALSVLLLVHAVAIVLLVREIAGQPAGQLVDAAASKWTGELRIAAWIELIAIALTAFAFTSWLYRAHVAVRKIGRISPTMADHWAVTAWFVPILNLWRPKLVVDETWRGSGPLDPSDAWSGGPGPPVVLVWWGLFVGSSIVELFCFHRRTQVVTTSDVRAVDQLALVAHVGAVVSLVLAIVIVARVTGRIRTRIERRPALPAEPAP